MLLPPTSAGRVPLADLAGQVVHGREVKRRGIWRRLITGDADATDEREERVRVVRLQQHRFLGAHIAERARRAFGQADVIAGVGDEGVVAGAYRQLPAQQVETVVDVVMHVERRGGAGTDVVLDDDRERALG